MAFTDFQHRMYNLSLSCTKIAILLQYLRVFGPVKAFRICCWTLMGVVIVYSFYTFFTAVFACTPIAFFWDNTIKGGKCLPRFPIWFGYPNSTSSGITWLTLFALQVRQRRHQHRHRHSNRHPPHPRPLQPRTPTPNQTCSHHSLPPGRFHMHRLDPPATIPIRHIPGRGCLMA